MGNGDDFAKPSVTVHQRVAYNDESFSDVHGNSHLPRRRYSYSVDDPPSLENGSTSNGIGSPKADKEEDLSEQTIVDQPLDFSSRSRRRSPFENTSSHVESGFNNLIRGNGTSIRDNGSPLSPQSPPGHISSRPKSEPLNYNVVKQSSRRPTVAAIEDEDTTPYLHRTGSASPNGSHHLHHTLKMSSHPYLNPEMIKQRYIESPQQRGNTFEGIINSGNAGLLTTVPPMSPAGFFLGMQGQTRTSPEALMLAQNSVTSLRNGNQSSVAKYTRPFKAYPNTLIGPSMGLGYLSGLGISPQSLPLASFDNLANPTTLINTDPQFAVFRENMLASKQAEAKRKQRFTNNHHSNGNHNNAMMNCGNEAAAMMNHSRIRSPQSTEENSNASNCSSVEEKMCNTVGTSSVLIGGSNHDEASGSGGEQRIMDMQQHQQQSQQPRKRNRSLPEELKDAVYWERRRKNNEAAKRSRDARRAKEDEIAIRAAYLEQENLKLRVEVTSLKQETTKLRQIAYNTTA